MSDQYDNTNRGAAFGPRDEKLVLQGKLNIEGQDYQTLIIRKDIGKGRVENVLYIRAAVLWNNTDKKSENSPDFSGKLELVEPGHYVAGWRKKSEAGANYMSMSVSPPMGEGGGKGGESRPSSEPGSYDPPDDEIPF